jgi:nitrate/TMAO reductase-like tetraheme cytochrome c subunit
MVKVTQADMVAAEAQAKKHYQTAYDYEMDLREAFATHRIEAAKAERGRLRELPDEVVKAAMDRANAMARQTLEGAFRIVAIALADALESQP